MSAQLTDEEALNRVASYCSTAEHCRAEINEKLQRWGIAYETIARILDQLEAEKFIDDERFCRAFVNDKFRFSKWGKMKIAQGLYMKKIPSDVAWRYLNEIDEEEYLSVLRDLLTSKRKSIHASDDYELNGKLMRFAMSRGFELKDIKRDFLVGNETVHALRGVSFAIQPGEFVTIMGTSGSGKSTLLNVLGCLDTPTAGEYWLDGYSVRQMGKNERAELRNHKIGFVFQSYNLLPKTTSIENVELPLMYNPAVSAKERERRAIEALDSVGLHDRLYHKSNQMSGGQQQRVAIARALVNDPVLILADEATGNLDTRTSFEILTLFQELYARGRTIVFVTHNPELSAYSSRTIVLKDGRVIQDTRNEKIASAKETLAALPNNED